MTRPPRAIRHRRRVRGTLGTTPIFTKDIGPGGFSAELVRVQAPGTPVEGSFRLCGCEISYAGVVAWAKAGVPHMALRGRMGVRFTKVSSEALALLAAATLLL